MTYDIKPGAVIHGDCLTVLRQMEAGSVDMVITDPPYGVDYQSNRPRSKNPAARFDKIANDKTPFIWWIYDAYRVLKEGGGALCFSRWDVQQVFMDALRLAGFTVKSVLVWDRMHHGMGDLKGSFAPRYDTCIFAAKGRYILPTGCRTATPAAYRANAPTPPGSASRYGSTAICGRPGHEAFRRYFKGQRRRNSPR